MEKATSVSGTFLILCELNSSYTLPISLFRHGPLSHPPPRDFRARSDTLFHRDKFVTRKEYDEIKDSLTRLQSLLPTNSLNSEAGFGSEGATYQSVSALTISPALSQPKSVSNAGGTRTLADIGTGVGTRSIDFPLPSRGPNTQHQPPVSYHASAHHIHQQAHPSSYNPITIAPPAAFSLPSLSHTTSSTAVPLLPPPFPSHLTLQRPSPQHPPHFQSDTDHTSLPSLRLPSHFIHPPLLQPVSNPQPSAGSFTSPPFANSLYQTPHPDTRSQSASSAALDPRFPSDDCHRDVSIDVDMSGSHSSLNDRGNSGEGAVWNSDGRVRPLSQGNDVSQGGDARYEPRGGQVGGGVQYDNYGLDRHQLCGTPPLDATEAIANAMAAQRGDFVGYKMLPRLPTFNLPNLNLQSRQEQADMTARSSRDNLPAPLSCAAPPAHPTPAGAQWTQAPLRSSHSLDPDSGTGVVNTLIPPRLCLEGRVAKEAEMKRTMRVCLPRKEVCDHLAEYYVSLLPFLPCIIN